MPIVALGPAFAGELLAALGDDDMNMRGVVLPPAIAIIVASGGGAMDSDGVIDNADRTRFELAVEGHIAFAAYTMDGDVITFTHTIVPKELEGRGIASRLIDHALGDVKARGLKIVPQCPFVAAYIRKHPEWAAVLA